MSEFSVVYTTAPNREAALALARAVVAEHLAGCVNLLEGMTSVYHWEGAVQEESEVALILKTGNGLVDSLIQRIAELHTYDTPCITSWPLSDVAPPYAAWLLAATAPSTRTNP